MPIEIRSSHTEAQSVGAGEVRTLEKGSPEWEQAAKEAMGILDTMDVRKRRTSNNGLLAYSHEGTCRFCKRDFKYSVNPSTPTKKTTCSHECRASEKMVGKGFCAGCHESHTGPDPFCKPECLTAWRRRHQRCLTCQDRTRLGQDFCSDECSLVEEPVVEEPVVEEPVVEEPVVEEPVVEEVPWGFCMECSKGFTNPRNNPRMRFCSKECRKTWRLRDLAQKTRERVGTVECAWRDCSSTFLRLNGRKRFCTPECGKAYQSEKTAAKRAEVTRQRKEQAQKVECAWKDCSNTFLLLQDRLRFCSSECRRSQSNWNKNTQRKAGLANTSLECAHERCSNTFVRVGQSRKRFCCKTCKDKQKVLEKARTAQVEVECHLFECSNTFMTSNKARRYCSTECKKKEKTRRVRVQRGGDEFVVIPELQCEICSTKFKPRAADRHKARFCSKGCLKRWEKDRAWQRRVELWANLECALCGIKFSETPDPRPVKPPKFCSPECRRDNQEIQHIKHRAKSRRRHREVHNVQYQNPQTSPQN